MMLNLPHIYNPEFFKEWGPHNTPYIETAKNIVGEIMTQFNPKSLIDIGCGCGVYSHYFSQEGCHVVSIDGASPPAENSFPIKIDQRDITEPFPNTWGQFDLTLCLEVAEHIPEILIDPFLRNVTQFSDRLLLSAAPPNQGGTHHVNEQPKRYWVEKLTHHGFLYNRKATGRFVELFKGKNPGFMWMTEHISVYDRVGKHNHLKEDQPFGVRLKG